MHNNYPDLIKLNSYLYGYIDQAIDENNGNINDDYDSDEEYVENSENE